MKRALSKKQRELDREKQDDGRNHGQNLHPVVINRTVNHPDML
jgi:hypothetical protein